MTQELWNFQIDENKKKIKTPRSTKINHALNSSAVCGIPFITN
jgi:hypothetical protein